MNYKSLKKPENLKEEVWDQHLYWMDVMGRQVDENFNKHLARVKEDASRTQELLKINEPAKRPGTCTQGLFSRNPRSGRV